VSENDYVATAAAEKRLREVLADRLPGATVRNVDDFAEVLLAGAKIEYKARSKQVVISLDIPDTAKTVSKAIVEPEEGVATAPEGTPIQAPPTPHLAPFAPAFDPDAEYEDVHFD
jgi:hypothetical protein